MLIQKKGVLTIESAHLAIIIKIILHYFNTQKTCVSSHCIRIDIIIAHICIDATTTALPLDSVDVEMLFTLKFFIVFCLIFANVMINF